MSNADEEISRTLDKINKLEARLAHTLLVNAEKSESDVKGLHQGKSLCLYYFLLGDAYMLLIKYPNTSEFTTVLGLDVKDRCLQAFELAVSTASSSLSIVERKNNNLMFSIYFIF
jgi:hypothetical protein